MPEPLDPLTTITVAFNKFKDTVTKDDAVVFSATKLEDVWKQALEIEDLHRKRRSLRGMRKVEPLLNAIEVYSKPVEILCQGTPYLPWIWVGFLETSDMTYLQNVDRLLGSNKAHARCKRLYLLCGQF
jgi:hypothetical protein